jgi:hypothetical protein
MVTGKDTALEDLDGFCLPWLSCRSSRERDWKLRAPHDLGATALLLVEQS